MAAEAHITSRREFLAGAASLPAAASSFIGAVALLEPSPLQRAIAEHKAAYAAYSTLAKGGDPTEDEELAFNTKVGELEQFIIDTQPRDKADLLALVEFTAWMQTQIIADDLLASTFAKMHRFIVA